MQPGQTITPGSPSNTPSWQFNPETPSQLPETQPQPSQPTATAQVVDTPPQPAAPAPPQPTAVNDGPSVNWTASEFIAHDKTGGWYMALVAGALLLAAIIYLLTKDPVPTGVILLVAILFGFAAARKPRELQYLVDSNGVQIASKAYPYSVFRSFSIVQESGIESIWFMPLKRFMPIVSIYFDPADGDKIVDILVQYLPVENRQLDTVDRLMQRLRF